MTTTATFDAIAALRSHLDTIVPGHTWADDDEVIGLVAGPMSRDEAAEIIRSLKEDETVTTSDSDDERGRYVGVAPRAARDAATQGEDPAELAPVSDAAEVLS